MKLLSFIKKSSYSLLIIISSLVFLAYVSFSNGVIQTPLGDAYYFEIIYSMIDSINESDEDELGMDESDGDELSMDELSIYEPNIDELASEVELDEIENIAIDDNQTELQDESQETTIDIENVQYADKSTEETIEDVVAKEELNNSIDIRSNVTERVWASTLNEEGDYSWLQEFESGITPVSFYTPEPTDSRYYKDLGIIAGNTVADYKVEGNSYFTNTCWIGDSRMLGIYDYSEFDADFYCDNGYCFYSYHLGKAVTYQNERRKVDLNEVFETKQYDKIYVVMGINDCGYMTTTDIRSYMKDFVDKIKETQPNALVFLCANMHVSRKVDASKPTLNNKNINSKNVALASLADGEKIFYIDYNYLYTDEEGFLMDENTFDGFHLYGKKYGPLLDFFTRHGIADNK